MKKLVLFSLLLLSVLTTVSCDSVNLVLEAQTLPVPARISWDNTAPAGSVSYDVEMDGTIIGSLNAPNTPLSFDFNIPTLGNHIFVVVTKGAWGNTASDPITISVVLPGKSTNVKIVKR